MRTTNRHLRYLCFAVICLAMALGSRATVAKSNDATPQAARIDALIARLGDPDYLRRQLAAAELRHLGLRAFDQLLEAGHSENAEIRLTARQLSAQLVLQWTQQDDPLFVRYAFKDYQAKPDSERTQRAVWLAAVEDGLGTKAVCRIVRYDLSDLVAKLAAVRLMEFFDPEVASQRESLSAAIEQVLLESSRPPARWLRAFLQGVDGHGKARLWQAFVEAESALDKSRTSPSVIASLMRQHIEHALRGGERDQAVRMLQRLVDLQAKSRIDLLTTCYWLIDEGHGELLLESAFQPMKNSLGDDPLFVYCQAEFVKGRDPQQAEQLAEAAFQLTVTNDELAGLPEQFESRYQASLYLDNRGQTEWAIREYERIAGQADLPSVFESDQLSCVRSFAELLHDRQRDREAADALEKMVNKKGRNRYRRGYGGAILSRMHYFRSEQFRREANRSAQMEQLEKGIQADPTDADVLIAMYHLPRADEQLQTSTRERISWARQGFESAIQELEGAGVVENRGDIATEANQIAWLIGNTEGDFQQAIEYSRKSLELRPQSGSSLDTLARAYFAAGDIDNAIKYQRRAAKLLPHSEQIRRQLNEFEMAWEHDERAK